MEAALYHGKCATKDVELARRQVLASVVWEEVAEGLDHNSFNLPRVIHVHVVGAFEPDDSSASQLSG